MPILQKKKNLKKSKIDRNNCQSLRNNQNFTVNKQTLNQEKAA